MAAQRKYPEELRERAVKRVFDIRERDAKGTGNWPGSAGSWVFTRRLWRSWVKQAEIYGGERPATTKGSSAPRLTAATTAAS
jgi:transposase